MSVTSDLLVNIHDSHTGGLLFSSNTIPNGSHTLPAPGSNIQSLRQFILVPKREEK